MSVKETLPAEAMAVLNQRRPSRPEYRLTESVSRWAAKSIAVGVTVPVVGGGLSYSTSEQPVQRKAIPLAKQVAIMEDFILKFIDYGKYFVLFDGLDQEVPVYGSEYQSWHSYKLILQCLFKACLDIKRTFNKSGKKVLPIVFVRNDIFELVNDPDGEKWNDSIKSLDWRRDQLASLVAYRITRAQDKTADASLNFNNAWSLLFSDKSIIIEDRKRGNYEKSIFDYIRSRTLDRPRDFIRYLQITAQVTSEYRSKPSRISADTVKNSEYNYSKRFRQEICNELFGVIPSINDLLEVFDKMTYGRHFGYDDFAYVLSEEIENGSFADPKIPAFGILQILHRYSVIGNVRRFQKPRHGSKYFRTFKYSRPTASLDIRQGMTIHSGLFKSVFPSQSEEFTNLADKDTEDYCDPPLELKKYEVLLD